MISALLYPFGYKQVTLPNSRGGELDFTSQWEKYQRTCSHFNLSHIFSLYESEIGVCYNSVVIVGCGEGVGGWKKVYRG